MEKKEAILKTPLAAHAAAAAGAGLPGARAGAEAAGTARPAMPAEARPYPRCLARAEAAAWRCPFKNGGGGRQRAREESSWRSRRRPERAAPASTSRATVKRTQNKPRSGPGSSGSNPQAGVRSGGRRAPANMALRRTVARPGWREEPQPAHTEGPDSGQGPRAPPPRRGVKAKPSPPPPRLAWAERGASRETGSGEGPEDERGAKEMGEKVLFLGLKNGGNRVLFSNLASGGAAVAPPPPPRSPLPRSARARPRPPKPPGRARGLLAPLGADSPPSSPPRPRPSARPAPTVRPDRRSPRPARAPSQAVRERSEPGRPSPG